MMFRTLVIGDAMLDEYLICDSDRPSPEDPSIKVYNHKQVKLCPGGALNVAANIASLTGRYCFYSGILTPFLNRFSEKKFVKRVPYLCSFGTTELVKQRLINKNGQQVCRIDYGHKFPIDECQKFEENLSKASKFLQDYDCIVVSDYCKGTITKKVVELLHLCHGLILVDTKNPDLSIWKNIKRCIVKINDKEDKKAQSKQSVDRVVTKGSEGAVLYFGEKNQSDNILIPGQKVENANVIGAGDVFLAGMAAFATKNRKIDLQAMLEYANRCAARSVSEFGTVIISNPDK